MPWVWRYGRAWLVSETERYYQEPDPSTEYCGKPLVGGWCKRRRGHAGSCACS